ncbi:unnamed protein product, partial [Rotaria sp. Silwood1]
KRPTTTDQSNVNKRPCVESSTSASTSSSSQAFQ